MPRRLPPLNALKAFEAAARSESLTRAAEELCVTQGAVSQQVKTLEATLGIKLFIRERQRLSIARALIRRPEIYLFDDSFSALDLATDARLRAALGPYSRDATKIVVAQRVSTIISADASSG